MEKTIKKMMKKFKKKNAQIKGPVSKNSSSRNVAAIMWFVAIPGFTFPYLLIVYIFRKSDPYVEFQLKEALNWIFTIIFAFVLWFFAMIFLEHSGGSIIFYYASLFLVVCHLPFCLWGANSSLKGVSFRVPFALRLLR